MSKAQAFNRAVKDLAPRRALMTRQAYLQAVKDRTVELMAKPIPGAARQR